jgi:hypothetical protein
MMCAMAQRIARIAFANMYDDKNKDMIDRSCFPVHYMGQVEINSQEFKPLYIVTISDRPGIVNYQTSLIMSADGRIWSGTWDRIFYDTIKHEVPRSYTYEPATDSVPLKPENFLDGIAYQFYQDQILAQRNQQRAAREELQKRAIELNYHIDDITLSKLS